MPVLFTLMISFLADVFLLFLVLEFGFVIMFDILFIFFCVFVFHAVMWENEDRHLRLEVVFQ